MTDTNNIQTIADNATENNLNAQPNTILTITWDDVRKIRDDLLFQVEARYRFDMPPALLKQFTDYKQALRDLPDTYKNLEDLSQIEWPTPPIIHQNLAITR
jgi:hypothetical protein